MATWRQRARAVISPILRTANAEQWDEKAIRKALYDAYPWEERKMYPYTVWCQEVKSAITGKPRKKTSRRQPPEANPAQGTLLYFGGFLGEEDKP